MIRSAELSDAAAIHAIACEVVADPWSLVQVEEEIARKSGEVLVVLEDSAIVAFAVTWFVADEASLLMIAVARRAQRRGVGAMVLEQLERTARTRGAGVVHLEVRASNESARAFYRARGYREVGVRAKYYGGEEDAVLMSRDLQPERSPARYEEVELVILAGGRGRRVGGLVKPLLSRADGMTILDALDRALSSIVVRTWLVAPLDLLATIDPFQRFVHVVDPGEGPARALLTTASIVRAEWMFVAGGDQPNLSGAVLSRLFSEVGTGVDCAVFEIEGVRQPLGALYRRSALLALTSPPSSLRGILDRLRVSVVVDPGFANDLADADTPEDLARLGLRC